MKKLFILLFITVIAVAAFGTDYALIIGINDYAHLTKLLYAENDAYDMAELLEGQGFDITFLVNSEATRENILYELRNIVNRATEKDSVMLFFSGHGMAGDNLNQRGFFSVDADLEGISQIPQEEIIDILKQTKANKIIFLDACFQGSRKKDMIRNSRIERFDIQSVVDDYELDLFIAASASNEAAYDGIVYDGNKIKNGIATYIFLEGMKSGDMDMDDNAVVTNGEIAKYFELVAEDISNTVSQKPEAAYSNYKIHLFTLAEQSHVKEEVYDEPVTETPSENKYSFFVNTDPTRCRVYINNVIFGYTPLKVNNIENDATLKIIKDGYEPYTIKLSEIEIQDELFFTLIKERTPVTTSVPEYQYNTTDITDAVEKPEDNIFNSDITIAVDKVDLYTNKVSNAPIIAKMNEMLIKTNTVEVVDRENIGNIIEEKKIDSSSNGKVIASAEYYINGNLYEDSDDIILYLYLLDMSDSTKHLTKTIRYGSIKKDSVFVENKEFTKKLKNYINKLVDYLCSPIKSNSDDHTHSLEIISNPTVRVNEAIQFDFETTYENVYFFTSSPSGKIEFIGNLEGGGHHEIGAEAEITDVNKNEVTEYLIAFGSEIRLSTDKLMTFRTIDDLRELVMKELRNYQYAIAFTSYMISR